MEKILVVDDELSMREFLQILLEGEGYTVEKVADGKQAIDALNKNQYDLVISDIKMPGVGGIEILEQSKKIQPNTPVIMITAYATPDTAIKAMKLGAYDFISKPFNVDQVKIVVKKAIERKNLVEENLLLKKDLDEKFQLENIIGKSKDMRGIFARIRKVADSPSTILLLGESGTGKELVARAIHNLSKRKSKPFVTINCAAITENLLESELFGHKKGSFTGADKDKKGLFEVADGGTFLLDEVSEAPLSIQAKLLRVLQEREFKRVGDVVDIRVDVRVIAATNRNLEKEVEDKTFREDLYYRLNVIAVNIPPLRERIEDLPYLIDHFIVKYNHINEKNIKGIAKEALSLLQGHLWPGNVRELENVIERAVVFEDSEKIEVDCLPDTFRKAEVSRDIHIPDIGEDGFDLEGFIESVEKAMLLKALDKAGGMKQNAARLLHMSFRSFRYKLQKYNISKG